MIKMFLWQMSSIATTQEVCELIQIFIIHPPHVNKKQQERTEPTICYSLLAIEPIRYSVLVQAPKLIESLWPMECGWLHI